MQTLTSAERKKQKGGKNKKRKQKEERKKERKRPRKRKVDALPSNIKNICQLSKIVPLT